MQQADIPVVILSVYLGLFSVVRSDTRYDCPALSYSGATVNTRNVRLQVAVVIGDPQSGDLEYDPGVPFPVRIRYIDGLILNLTASASPPFGSNQLPVGTWAVLSGAATSSTCVNVGDILVSSSLGNSGTIMATWTPPLGLKGYMEITIRMGLVDGSFSNYISPLVRRRT